MPDHKKHHYVPKFYLRRFAPSANEICIYHIEKAQVIERGKLANQCYKNYLHGKDPALEKKLGEIEGQTASVIERINDIVLEPSVSEPEINQLRLFSLIQYGRTLQFGLIARAMTESLFDEVAKIHSGFTHQQSHVTSDATSYGNNTVKHIEKIISLHPVSVDLDFVLLRNETDIDFVTSDNPVALYNQLLSANFKGSTIGLASKGLQLFYPVSPRCVVHFFDASSYGIRGRSGRAAKITNRRDVIEINSLQYCSAVKNLYSSSAHFDFRALARKAHRSREDYYSRLSEYSVDSTQRNTKFFLLSASPEVRLNLRLSFATIRKNAKALKRRIARGKELRDFIPRDPTLMRINGEFQEACKQGRYGVMEFDKFLTDAAAGD